MTQYKDSVETVRPNESFRRGKTVGNDFCKSCQINGLKSIEKSPRSEYLIPALRREKSLNSTQPIPARGASKGIDSGRPLLAPRAGRLNGVIRPLAKRTSNAGNGSANAESDRIEYVPLSQETRRRYLNYAMSVITSRAL